MGKSAWLAVGLTLAPFTGGQAAGQTPDQPIMRLGIGVPQALAYSPDGKSIAVGTSTGVVLLDAGTLGFVRDFFTFTVNVGKRLAVTTAVIFSPDGRLIASGSDDGKVWLWDVTTGKRVRALSGHTGPVTSVAFSPDGRLLASGSRDQTVALWETGISPQTLTVAKVVLSPAKLPLKGGRVSPTVGATETFTATAYDAAGNPVEADPIAYRVVGEVGTIDPATGQFTASRKAGLKGSIEATIGGVTTSIEVITLSDRLVKITLTPDKVTLRPGESVTFQATGFDRFDNRVDFRPTWFATGNIGKINPATGVFKAGDKPGKGSVIAQTRGANGKANVEVVAASSKAAVPFVFRLHPAASLFARFGKLLTISLVRLILGKTVWRSL